MFAEERGTLLPLPLNAFEHASWIKAKVAFNYHVEVDGRYYSVPYEYIRHEVEARITRNVVEVFHAGTRICSHVRNYDLKDKYSTQDSHMPPKHQQYAQWNGDRFRRWAAKIGPQTVSIVESILTGYKVEQQGYRTCMALLKLSEGYSPERLEAACIKALSYTPRPSYQYVQTILRSGQDKQDVPVPAPASKFGFTRGADYYRGGQK